MRRFKRAAIALAFGMTLSAVAQDGPRTYVVGDQEIELTPSETYRGILTKSVAPEELEREFNRVGLTTVELIQSPILQQFDAVLMALPEPGPRRDVFNRAFAQVLMAMTFARAEEAPVYEFQGMQHVLVNSFSLQLARGVDAAGAEDVFRVIRDGGGALTENPRIEGRYLAEFARVPVGEALRLVNRLNFDFEETVVDFAGPNFVLIAPASVQPGSAQPPAAPGGVSPQGGIAPDGGPQNIALTNCVPELPVAVSPRDPRLHEQWALNQTKALEAWAITKGSTDVRIAIVDEGVDALHEDLKERLILPYDATDWDTDASPLPADAHGTATAGVAAAATDNEVGIAGTAWLARIIPIRVASRFPDSPDWNTNYLFLEDGIRTAVDPPRNADIVSNSWSGGLADDKINSAIEYAVEQRGSVVVFSAGNHMSQTPQDVRWPASRPDVIAVSATNKCDVLKTMDDGQGPWASGSGSAIDIAAPGVEVDTADNSGPDGYLPGDYNEGFWGTSAAAPLVAGAAALLRAIRPDATPGQVKLWLQAGADDLGLPVPNPSYGFGRLNVANALNAALTNSALTLELEPEQRLPYGFGSTTSVVVRAIVRAQSGQPVSNVTVTFEAGDPSLLAISASSVDTNVSGIAQTHVLSKSRLNRSVTVTAQVASLPPKSLIVEVGGVSRWQDWFSGPNLAFGPIED